MKYLRVYLGTTSKHEINLHFNIHLIHIAGWEFYTIFLEHLCFNCNSAHLVRYAIFHLWHQINAQKVLSFGVFWISNFCIRNAQPELSLGSYLGSKKAGVRK